MPQFEFCDLKTGSQAAPYFENLIGGKFFSTCVIAEAKPNFQFLDEHLPNLNQNGPDPRSKKP